MRAPCIAVACAVYLCHANKYVLRPNRVYPKARARARPGFVAAAAFLCVYVCVCVNARIGRVIFPCLRLCGALR